MYLCTRAFPSRVYSRCTLSSAVFDLITASGSAATNASNRLGATRSSTSQSSPLYFWFAWANARSIARGSRLPGRGIDGNNRKRSLYSSRLVSNSRAALTACLPALSLSNNATKRYRGRPFGSKHVRPSPRNVTNSRITPRVPPRSRSPAQTIAKSVPTRSMPVLASSKCAAS